MPDHQPGNNLKSILEENREADFDEQTLRNITHAGEPELEKDEKRVFVQALRVINKTEVPYGVGGAFARYVYTGIWRTTKDLDIFVKPEDLKKILDALEEAGFRIQIEFEHWLAKAWKDPYFVDLIFGTGHGQLPVDQSWFKRTRPTEILGVKARLMPVEEIIASASFVAERSRFDASEVAHLIRGRKGKIDWERVLELLGEHWELLLWQLLFFDIVYPGHSNYLPQHLMGQLFKKVQRRWTNQTGKRKEFRGTIIDPFSFTVDTEDWGYEDRRNLEPLVDEEGELR